MVAVVNFLLLMIELPVIEQVVKRCGFAPRKMGPLLRENIWTPAESDLMLLSGCLIVGVCVTASKLSEQEAREKANTDQLVSTDIRTKEFENMVQLYKYAVLSFSLLLF